ncbi:MAG: winged helix-turn-helix domain-containing protein [Acidobacteria bacterium]|nr:winged helix-turn-helix domain-containing protein [Acidobacteriota bacterium]
MTHTYCFDDVLVEANTFRIFKDGLAVGLEPKAFEVLALFLNHPGRLFTKEDILNAVWKNSYVTPNVMTRVIAQLRKALGDTRKEPKYIETIQTRGYRFIAKIEAPTLTVQSASLSLPARQFESLAVLPLENLSDDAAQEYFADGLTDELITEVAKLNAWRVTSRTSIMQYKRARKSLPQIASELKVDAVLEGTVMRAGNRVRITAQLIRADNDHHLWAESYERTIVDVFDLQREVAHLISQEVLQHC